MRRVLVITSDPTGVEMGGNAIRATELSRVLSSHAETTLASPGEAPHGVEDHVRWDLGDPRALRAAIARADVVVTTPQSPVVTAWLRRSPARLIYDLYDPGPLETLQSSGDASLRRYVGRVLALDYLLDALHAGHHFICATERQRDLWIGAMLAQRLITPALHERDPDLRATIDVVPFGISSTAPRSGTGAGARRRFESIGQGDEIVLWNGGIWNWLDPGTPVEAMPGLLERRPNARLVFMGRPPHLAAEAEAADRARARAQDLGLLDRAVFFNDGWVPYDERADWLLEADCAVSTHLDHLETRFAFRTRLLDCLWAGLPIVCTTGDELSERVAREDLGAVVPPADPGALAGALADVLSRGRAAYSPQLARAAADFAWPRVAGPLIRHVTASGPVPPRLGATTGARLDRPVQRARAMATRAGRAGLRALRRP